MNNIEVEGLDRITDKLDNVASVQSVEGALMKCCALVERAAKQNAQKFRGTGELSRSISSKIEGNTGVVFTVLEYAPYVEYGTGLFAEGGNGRKDVPWCYYDEKTDEFVYTEGMHPQPFMRPALDENINKINRILKEGITG